FLFFFFAWILSISAKNIVLPENTPFYKVPDPTTSAVLIVQKEMQVEVTNIKRFQYYVGIFLIDSPMYEITPPGQKSVWAAPGFEYQQKTGKIILRKNKTLCTQALFCLAGAILTAFLCFIKHKKQFLTYLLPGISILLFCAGLIGYAYGASGHLIQNPIDERVYYDIAKRLADWDFTKQWSYTIGHPLLYIPFLIFTGTADFLDFYYPFHVFNLLVISPLMFYSLYLIGRKFSGHNKAFSAILLFLTLVFFWQFRYQVNDTTGIFKNYISASYPLWTTYDIGYPLYNLYSWLGFNAMSDTPATMFLILTACLLLLLPAKKINLAIIAVIFSFCCLIRMNNILYAPALFFLFVLKYKNLQNWKEYFTWLFPAGIVFILIFSPQLIINTVQFGSPFTTAYSLHPKEDVGWTINVAPAIIQFFYTCHKAWFLPAFLSLLFLREKELQKFSTLWCFPALFFYCVYMGSFNHAIRFIMPIFPVLALTIAACPLWYQMKNWRNWRLILCILSCITMICTWIPEKWINTDGPWGITGKNAEILTITGICIATLFALSFAVEYYFYRKQKNNEEARNVLSYVIFSVLFLLLWIEPTGYGVFALSMAAFLYICRDIFLDIFSGLKQQRQEKKSTD
ncbi:MAG: hypothetical protein IKB16_15435, partial [Lentisphaeria bacterium]|nr:hypothetical protein [Lentisphaeria bacterium]